MTHWLHSQGLHSLRKQLPNHFFIVARKIAKVPFTPGHEGVSEVLILKLFKITEGKPILVASSKTIETTLLPYSTNFTRPFFCFYI